MVSKPGISLPSALATFLVFFTTVSAVEGLRLRVVLLLFLTATARVDGAWEGTSGRRRAKMSSGPTLRVVFFALPPASLRFWSAVKGSGLPLGVVLSCPIEKRSFPLFALDRVDVLALFFGVVRLDFLFLRKGPLRVLVVLPNWSQKQVTLKRFGGMQFSGRSRSTTELPTRGENAFAPYIAT